MSDPKRMREFQALWSRFAGRASSRDDRLLWLTRLLGKPVDSAAELNDEELALAARELRREMGRGSRKVVGMRGAPEPGGGRASREQVWKVHQLEAWLEWRAVPERLAGFLREKFRVGRAEELSPRDAWRAIEALYRVAAQRAVGELKGVEAKRAKAAEVRRLKEVLRTWRESSRDPEAA